MRTRYKIIWGGGIVSAVVYFFWFEIPAIRSSEPNDTLSEFVWWLLDTHPIITAILAGLILFLGAWLPVHFIGRGKWDKPVSRFLARLFNRGE